MGYRFLFFSFVFAFFGFGIADEGKWGAYALFYIVLYALFSLYSGIKGGSTKVFLQGIVSIVTVILSGMIASGIQGYSGWFAFVLIGLTILNVVIVVIFGALRHYTDQSRRDQEALANSPTKTVVQVSRFWRIVPLSSGIISLGIAFYLHFSFPFYDVFNSSSYRVLSLADWFYYWGIILVAAGLVTAFVRLTFLNGLAKTVIIFPSLFIGLRISQDVLDYNHRMLYYAEHSVKSSDVSECVKAIELQEIARLKDISTYSGNRKIEECKKHFNIEE